MAILKYHKKKQRKHRVFNILSNIKYKYSVVFSARNRKEQLEYSLPVILNMYKERDDVEIVCMDDNSSDGTTEYLSNIIKDNDYSKNGKNIFRVFQSCRDKNTGYNKKVHEQYNFLVDQAKGEFIILQNAETLYKDDIVKGLSQFCSDKKVSFATVVNLDKSIVNDDTFLNRIRETLILPDCDIQNNNYSYKIYKQIPYLGKKSRRYLPLYKLKIEDKIYCYHEYCGPNRPYPLFFCGMIKKSDYIAAGRYKNTEHADMAFGNSLVNLNFELTFTNYLAVHISHNYG